MPIETRTLSGKNPKLKINLTEMFGQRVPDSAAFKEAVGQAIIDRIRERTAGNIGRDGKRFKNYKKKTKANPNPYSESLEFKAAGKSIGDPNLRLSGDMLGFMDVIDESRDTITIGFSEREDQLKAHGHILGSNPGPRVRRDFFGLPGSEYSKIAAGFRPPSPESEEVQRESGILSKLLTLREIFSG